MSCDSGAGAECDGDVAEEAEASVQLSLKQQLNLAIQRSMSDEVQPTVSPNIVKSTTAAIRSSELNSLYFKRRAFEEDASSWLTATCCQFRRHPSRPSERFLQLDYCAQKFVLGCRTNHWTHCASYDLIMLVLCAKLMISELA